MDLIDEFDPPSSKGNKYVLTAVCMLTGYTFCIPLKKQIRRRNCDSLEKSHRLSVWCLQKTADG